LEQHTKDTLKQMKHWARDENFHVRRLSCEGVRPRLPWAKKLDIFILNPKPILPILNTLKDDKSKYVQKSVANCINDILKDNEVIGKDLLDSWKTKNRSKERQWIMKHAVRNLIKKDDVWAKKLIS
jgi:3-methyladenine DNA glycosylase AlkC